MFPGIVASAVSDLPNVPGPEIAAALVAISGSAWMAGLLAVRFARGQPLVRPETAEPVVWDGMDVAWIVGAMLMLQSFVAALGPVPPSVRLQLLSGMLATGAAAGLAAALLRWRGASCAALGFRVTDWWCAIRLGVGTVLLVVAPLLALAACLDRIVPYRHPIVEFLAAHRDAASVALVWLAATVVAPIVEEFFFRRILQGWLEQRLTAVVPSAIAKAVAIIGAALLFGLAHVGQGLAWVPLVGLGMVLGYLARQTGTIVPGILAHALFNAVSLVLVLLQPPS